jgi:hypothetical protein
MAAVKMTTRVMMKVAAVVVVVVMGIWEVQMITSSLFVSVLETHPSFGAVATGRNE